METPKKFNTQTKTKQYVGVLGGEMWNIPRVPK